MTKDNISLLNNTGTELDNLGILEKKEIESKIIKDIVNFIVKNCNFESNVYFDSTLDRQNFQKYFCGNNNKIVSMTDWKEKYTLEQGLINTIERFKNVTRF